jgi:hypothetical protein
VTTDIEWSITPYTKGNLSIDSQVMADLAGEIIDHLVSDQRLPNKRFRSCVVRIEGHDFSAAAVADTKLAEASVYFTATFEEAREKNQEVAAFLGLPPVYRDGRPLA